MAVDVKKLSFRQDQDKDFHSELRKRVMNFFKEKGKSPKANFFMYAKSIFLMGIAFILYGVLLSNVLGSYSLALYPVLGFLFSIGMMNIAHDALHGAYVTNVFGNRSLGYLMDILGTSSFYWKKEHTIEHHTYTNIDGYDADLDVPFVLRLCPEAPYHRIHRFQHLYAPFLYSLNLIHWIYFSDIKRICHIIKNASHQKIIPLKEIIPLFIFKILHALCFIALPILCLSMPWWQVVLGYVAFLATAGIIVTVIFQLAHIVENVAFPQIDQDGKVPQDFLRHQLSTTSNFATQSRIVTFLFGGLNFQVEHHIFPHICHIHLRKISPIVKATAKEFGLPYHENRSFFSAIASHFRTLRKLGNPPKKSE